MSDAAGEVLARIRSALTEAGVAFTHTTHDPVYTSAEAAAVRGVPLHSGAKALIVKGDAGFVMIIMPADLSLDGAAARKLLGSRRLRFANKDELAELTGLTPGAVPPFGSLFGLETICDERLADNTHINFNAGSHSDSFQMTYEAYVAYEKPRIAAVAKAPDPAP